MGTFFSGLVEKYKTTKELWSLTLLCSSPSCSTSSTPRSSRP